MNKKFIAGLATATAQDAQLTLVQTLLRNQLVIMALVDRYQPCHILEP